MSNISNIPDAAPRLTAVDGGKLGIKSYGADNGYPQRMQNLYNASGSAKMCANLCATYLIGKGFEDIEFYHAVINQKGLTPDKLLRRIANDKSRFRGVALHVNYNALYQISEINYVPFENCREGAGDNVNKIGIYADWYSKNSGSRRSSSKVDFIDVYDPNPMKIEAQVIAAGGWDYYNGQVIYLSDDFETYPLATIDPVLDDVQAEIESANTRKNNLRNNFTLKQIWVEKGQLQTDETEEEVVEDVREFMGSDGKPVAVVFSKDPDGKDIPQLISVPSVMNDKLFQYTDQTARLAIYTAFGQPAILHSDYLGTNGYNEGQLPQSMAYYNAFTEPDRIFLEELFTELFTNFDGVSSPSGSYRITPLDVVNDGIKVEEEDTRPLIEVIGIGGVQALQAIQGDTTTTPEQKRDTIMIIFGVTEEDANKLSNYTPENAAP